MRAIVLVKQVPDLRGAPIGVRPDGTIDRARAAAITNPADLHALEAALNMADEVWALSMGPPTAETALREAVSLGATRAVLLCDRLLAGSDTWATANALAAAIHAARCGRSRTVRHLRTRWRDGSGRTRGRCPARLAASNRLRVLGARWDECCRPADRRRRLRAAPHPVAGRGNHRRDRVRAEIPDDRRSPASQDGGRRAARRRRPRAQRLDGRPRCVAHQGRPHGAGTAARSVLLVRRFRRVDL